LSESKDCKFEGLLEILEDNGKFWSKGEVLKHRWCRLIGNILFCLKTELKNSEVSGIFILEGSYTVGKVQENSFYISFGSEEESYYFRCQSVEDADKWVVNLQSASYTSLKNKYRQLVDQLKQESTA